MTYRHHPSDDAYIEFLEETIMADFLRPSKTVYTASTLATFTEDEWSKLDDQDEVYVVTEDNEVHLIERTEPLYGANWLLVGFRLLPEHHWPDNEPSNGCHECERSRGPNYEGPCDH